MSDKKERVPVVSRSFNKDIIKFEDFVTKRIVWEKSLNGTATAKEIVNAISEFTDKHWDKKSPWTHSVESAFEIYEMTQKEFIKNATKLEGKELEKRIEQINKNRGKRGNK